MEKGIRKSCNLEKREKPFQTRNECKKEVNSWDCSTPTSNGKTSRGKPNDWDSGSECQETMVEPFENDENPKDRNDWDSESEKINSKNDSDEEKAFNPFSMSGTNSCDLSVDGLSFGVSPKGDRSKTEDELLLVEDFEEFLNENTPEKSVKVEELSSSPRASDLETENEKVRSNESEGTPKDTTVWMIPKSEGTQSREFTSKLISSSDRELETHREYKCFFKKSKSQSDVPKIKVKRRKIRSSRSECLGPEKNDFDKFFHWEGSNLKRKLEIESEKLQLNISGGENFDRNPVFFTEYECRTVKVDENIPEKLPLSSNPLEEDLIAPSNESMPERNLERNAERSSDGIIADMPLAGPSGAFSMDVISLPDMIGKKSMQKRQKEVSYESNKKTHEYSETEGGKSEQINESWLLLDDKGQYQTISRNVVSLLLNGRSAEAVLQGRKEHFIPNVKLRDSNTLRDSLSSVMANDSANALKKDDLGGEDDRKKVIDLERKVENTLIYIQPGMNQTASVRIIPMDIEMIHVWRRTRVGGSALSLEADLMNPSQDSVELITNQSSPFDGNLTPIRRPFGEETVSEEDKDSTTVKRHRVPVLSGLHETEVTKYTKLLFETRVIVDSLTNNFKALQNRLEGETRRNVTLQSEVHKLRLLMKNCAGRYLDGTIGEADIQSDLTTTSGMIKDHHSDVQSEMIAEERIDENYRKITLEVEDKSTCMDCKEYQCSENHNVDEPSEVITVNIYTMETAGPADCSEGNQHTCSMVQSNLKIIEDRMKNLQEENEFLLKQNVELKRKLKEISMELEKYLSGTSELEYWVEDGKEPEATRDQVCNLKLEPENLKIVLKEPKKQLTGGNSSIREEPGKSFITLKKWRRVAIEIFEKIESIKTDLQKSEIELDVKMEEVTAMEDPKNFSVFVTTFIEETAKNLLKMKDENFLFEETLNDLRKESNTTKEMSGLDEVISGYAELIEQCRKGQITSETESKMMEDYFTVIMEKASLVQEIKILKTENEMLLESQMEHYEKLKQTMIALKDRKSEVTALESSQKLMEEEKTAMEEVLKVCEEEKKTMEMKIMEKSKVIDDLMEKMKRKDLEVEDCKEKMKATFNEIENFEKSCRLKDELINKFKLDYDELLTAEGVKDKKIEILQDEIRNLEMRGAQLEGELTSSKLFLNESQKEMTDYITHLEALVNTSQDSIDKIKQKLKESNQTINRLKNENEILDKQHQCDVKLFNNTKDELNLFKEKLTKTENKLKETEEEREKLLKKCEGLAGSEKEKSEALESLSREFKEILNENSELTEKVEIFSKDKDELLKEQRELINKYGILSKEIQKVQDKYRNVKTECNERTDLIKYLEMMLKENLVEYNNRISCLEQNISRIIEKIAVCKNGIRERHFADAEVRELRQQLDVTCRERKEMEMAINNYYSLTKQLEQEVQEREKKVHELHAKLSLEQRKAEEENDKKSTHILTTSSSADRLKIQQLEKQIAETEDELSESKKEVQRSQSNFENEKRKLELVIADMKSEIKRYQLRIEVMMRNFSNCNRNLNGLTTDKRSTEDSEIQVLKKDLKEKDKTISELKATINKFKSEIELKDIDLENTKKGNFVQDEELKNLQNQIAQMREAASTACKTNEIQQKEKDEITEKLFESIKLIMEERSARQTIETLVVEKEKNFKNQIEEVKNELTLKTKELETVLGALEQKKKIVCKLQDELRKLKGEISLYKSQVRKTNQGKEEEANEQRKGISNKGNGDGIMLSDHIPLVSPPATSQKVSPERLESCLKELKEIRELNLQLRQTEGQYQAKIVRLEDEIRDARLLIKELQGDIKTEKKSKKAFKNMIMAAKTEIEKCVLAKQLMSVIAERISRHLDLSEIPSREFLSGFRLSNASSSSKCTLE